MPAFIGTRRALLGGPRRYKPNAVDFNGSADYLTRGADLTGSADSATGILSVWLRRDADGAISSVLRNTGSFVLFRFVALNNFNVQLFDAAGTSSLQWSSTPTYTATGAWLHFLISWDTNAAAGAKVIHIYVNDATVAGTTTDANPAFNIDYTRADWAAAGSPAGGELFSGAFADLWFAQGQFLDFSVTDNRRKFIDKTGRPVSLGSDGSKPLGSAPILYLPNPAATVNVNPGTGGNMTLNGAPVDASSRPGG